MFTPCLNCGSRSAECHIRCTKYVFYRTLKDLKNEKAWKDGIGDRVEFARKRRIKDYKLRKEKGAIK